MNLSKFAEKYRLNLKPGEDGTDIIPGAEGDSHVFEYADDLLGVMIMPHTGTAHRWRTARAAFLAAGMAITQNGDAEGVATFDPNNADQVRLALRYARVRRKKTVSKDQADRLRTMGFGGKRRAKKAANGTLPQDGGGPRKKAG